MNQRETQIQDLDHPTEQLFDLFGVLLQFLVTPHESHDLISIYRGTLPPGVFVPLHCHDEPEIFYVTEGVLEIYREGGPSEGWTTATVGEVITIPNNMKHALRNTSTTPFTVVMVARDELYGFFRDIAKPFRAGLLPVPPTPEEMQKLFVASAKYHYWMGSPEENEKIGISLG